MDWELTHLFTKRRTRGERAARPRCFTSPTVMTQNLNFTRVNPELLPNNNNNNNNNNNSYIYGVVESTTQASTLLLIIILGVLGNLYCARVIYKNKKLRNPTFIFLFNLAVCNIGALLLCTPFPLIISFRRNNVLGTFWCRASGFLNNLFFCASIITFSLITTQKYYTVVRPTKCTFLHITKTKARYSVLVVWLICSLLSVMILGPFEGWNYVVFNDTTAHCGIAFPRNISDRARLGVLALAAFILPICIMSYAYGRIYSKVRSHERSTQRRGTARMVSNSVKGKLAVTLCLMFGTFALCWFPFFLLIILSIALESASELPWSLGRIAYWSGYLNCCINPTLYCLRSSAFREALRRRTSLSGREQLERVGTARRSRRAHSLPPLSARLRKFVMNGGERRNAYQMDQSVSSEAAEQFKLPRPRAYSCSSSYDLKIVRENNEEAAELRGTYIAAHELSTFGAQHEISTLVPRKDIPYGASMRRPTTPYDKALYSARSDACYDMQKDVEYLESDSRV